MAVRILVVERERRLAPVLSEALEALVLNEAPQDLTTSTVEHRPALVVVDLEDQGIDALDRLGELFDRVPDAMVVLVAGEDQVDVAELCLETGAYEALVRPFGDARLVRTASQALDVASLRRQLGAFARQRRMRRGLPRIVGASAGMRRVKRMVRQLAKSDVPLLVQGEDGTGKHTLVHAIHAESSRCSAPIVRVPCAAFGEHEAWMGDPWPELFNEAEEGTLFLEDVDRLPMPLQQALAQRLGWSAPQLSRRLAALLPDVRLLATTETNLEALCAAKAFHPALLRELSRFCAELPPLRKRREDVRPLAEGFLSAHARRLKSPARAFEPGVLRALREFDWPGNVRQLEQTVEHMVLFAETEWIGAQRLPLDMRRALVEERAGEHVPTGEAGLEEAREGIRSFAQEERRILDHALRTTEWNVGSAAAQLGIGRATLYRKIQKYDLRRAQ